MTVSMVDGISSDVPAILAKFGTYQPVAGYITGGWPIQWNGAQFGAFHKKIRIVQQPGMDQLASQARVLDVERGAAAPQDAPRFVAARLAAGHEDATIYCSLSVVQSVLDAMGGVEPPRWWLAWYRSPAPLQEDVVAELHQQFGVDIDPLRLWACQWENTSGWDVSVVYGKADFS